MAKIGKPKEIVNGITRSRTTIKVFIYLSAELHIQGLVTESA
jgi:hypothetical protein